MTDRTPEEIRQDLIDRRGALVGTPDEVRRQLSSLREELGLSGFLVEPNVGGMMHADAVDNSIRLFASEVVPALRDD